MAWRRIRVALCCAVALSSLAQLACRQCLPPGPALWIGLGGLTLLSVPILDTLADLWRLRRQRLAMEAELLRQRAP